MSATLNICDYCKETSSDANRFCPSCGKHQRALAELGTNQNRNETLHSGELIMDTRQTSPKPVTNQVGYSTHLNVVPNQGPAVVPPAQTINVNVAQPNVQPYYPQPEENYTFVILTLLAYIFVFPFGALMNLIGLISGPRRGCFAAMFFLILVPTVCLGLGLIVLSLIVGSTGP